MALLARSPSSSHTSLPRVSGGAQGLHVVRSQHSEAASARLNATLRPVTGRSVWYAKDMRENSGRFTFTLTADDLGEIEAAANFSLKKGVVLEQLTKETFPLPGLGPKLDAIRREVLAGQGFYLLRGFNVAPFLALRPSSSGPAKDAAMARIARSLLGLSLYWGSPRPQNRQGHLLGHVADLGLDPSSPTVRIYATSAAQPFHTDSVDLVGLLCLTPALDGGLSSWCSSHALYNELLRVRPDLAAVLAEPFVVDRKGEIPPGKGAYYKMPVFNFEEGQLSVIYARGFIEAALRHPEVPRLTPMQVEALNKVDSLAASDDLRLDWTLQPGDIQLLHNHQTLHARSAFTDAPGQGRGRHLLRLWLCPPDGIPLPQVFAERYSSIQIGDRGGIVVEGQAQKVPLWPE